VATIISQFVHFGKWIDELGDGANGYSAFNNAQSVVEKNAPTLLTESTRMREIYYHLDKNIK
jgi:hypothetical protein